MPASVRLESAVFISFQFGATVRLVSLRQTIQLSLATLFTVNDDFKWHYFTALLSRPSYKGIAMFTLTKLNIEVMLMAP